MKTYVPPVLEIIEFDAEDVLTASDPGNDGWTPGIPLDDETSP